jgi:hypothetical protein
MSLMNVQKYTGLGQNFLMQTVYEIILHRLYALKFFRVNEFEACVKLECLFPLSVCIYDHKYCCHLC